MKPSASDTLLPSSASSSGSSSPPIGLQSPKLQEEFLQVFRDKFQSHSDFSQSGNVSSPLPSFSPTLSSPRTSSSSPSSPCHNNRQARLSLSSPELLSELRDSGTRPLRHVVKHNGLTTVFSGRGRGRGHGRGRGPVSRDQQVNGPTPSS